MKLAVGVFLAAIATQQAARAFVPPTHWHHHNNNPSFSCTSLLFARRDPRVVDTSSSSGPKGPRRGTSTRERQSPKPKRAPHQFDRRQSETFTNESTDGSLATTFGWRCSDRRCSHGYHWKIMWKETIDTLDWYCCGESSRDGFLIHGIKIREIHPRIPRLCYSAFLQPKIIMALESFRLLSNYNENYCPRRTFSDGTSIVQSGYWRRVYCSTKVCRRTRNNSIPRCTRATLVSRCCLSNECHEITSCS
jgi:hypothetical protein